jgi:hypothetical protein
MLAQRSVAVLLLLPLLALISVGILYWIKYGKQEKSGAGKQEIAYHKVFLALVGSGYLSMYSVWIGGIVMLLLARWYDSVFGADWVAPVAAPGQVFTTGHFLLGEASQS